MKKFLLLSMLLTLLGANAYADDCYEDVPLASENNLYVNVFGGANFLKVKHVSESELKTGYVFSVSLGYYLPYNFRFEGEYAFRRNHIKEFDTPYKPTHRHFHTSSYMGNLIWDLPVSRFCLHLQPFIGGGMGYDRQGTDHQQYRNKHLITVSKGQFAWQVVAGVGYPIFRNVDISFLYKLHKNNLKQRVNHSFGLGLTYKFGARVEFWH